VAVPDFKLGEAHYARLRGSTPRPSAIVSSPASQKGRIAVLQPLHNVNVLRHEVLTKPDALKAALPASECIQETVAAGRQAVNQILTRGDPRLLVVVGPCSIHDPEAAREYGRRLAALARELEDTLLLVMRVYFEKPRTSIGWKGLINDPHLDGTFRIDEGLHLARQLLLELSAQGLPLATEALDPITPQYLQDLISWSAIGARTTESQTHREMASGLSSAVGFKNGTDGSLDSAVNAIKAAATAQSFLGMNDAGEVAIYHTRGNAHAHLVLRGGHGGPNYEPDHIAAAEEAMGRADLAKTIVVDCSHANSNKDYRLQEQVVKAIGTQILAGNRSIVGLMLESNLAPGQQPMAPREEMTYGVSVTDGCLGWEETEGLLRALAHTVGPSLPGRLSS